MRLAAVGLKSSRTLSSYSSVTSSLAVNRQISACGSALEIATPIGCKFSKSELTTGRDMFQ